MLEWATQNSKTRRALTLKTQTRLNSSSKKIWKTRITRAKTRNTWANVELDTCLNSKVWNSMKLELDIKWARTSISKLQCEYFSNTFMSGDCWPSIEWQLVRMIFYLRPKQEQRVLWTWTFMQGAIFPLFQLNFKQKVFSFT